MHDTIPVTDDSALVALLEANFTIDEENDDQFFDSLDITDGPLHALQLAADFLTSGGDFYFVSEQTYDYEGRPYSRIRITSVKIDDNDDVAINLRDGQFPESIRIQGGGAAVRAATTHLNDAKAAEAQD